MPSKLTKAARGKSCTLEIFPYCNQNPETVVGCHLNSDAKGWGIKSPDWWLVDACSSCHDVIDGRMKTDLSKEDIDKCVLRGLYRTLKSRIEEGLISVPKN